MTLQDLLANDLDAARQAVRQLTPFIDPRLHLGRIGWALGEIQAKLVATTVIDEALARASRAFVRLTIRLNDPAVFLEGLGPEQAKLLALLAALEAVLQDAAPNDETRFLFDL